MDYALPIRYVRLAFNERVALLGIILMQQDCAINRRSQGVEGPK